MSLSYRVFSSGNKFGAIFTALTTVLSVFVSFLVTLGLGFDAAEIVLACLAALWFTMMLSMMMSLHFVSKSPRWLMCLIGKLAPGSMPVMMMDFQGTIYYSLAWETDGEWVAPVYWGTNVGKVYLNRNGSCGRRDCGYVYLWEPLRQSDRAHFFLLNIDQPSRDEFANWSPDERTKWVENKLKESQ